MAGRSVTWARSAESTADRRGNAARVRRPDLDTSPALGSKVCSDLPFLIPFRDIADSGKRGRLEYIAPMPSFMAAPAAGRPPDGGRSPDSGHARRTDAPPENIESCNSSSAGDVPGGTSNATRT